MHTKIWTFSQGKHQSDLGADGEALVKKKKEKKKKKDRVTTMPDAWHAVIGTRADCQ